MSCGDIYPAMSWDDRNTTRNSVHCLPGAHVQHWSGVAPGDEQEWELTGLPDTVGIYWENPFTASVRYEDRALRTTKKRFPRVICHL